MPAISVLYSTNVHFMESQALTLDNQNVTFSITGGTVYVNGAAVIAADIQVSAR